MTALKEEKNENPFEKIFFVKKCFFSSNLNHLASIRVIKSPFLRILRTLKKIIIGVDLQNDYDRFTKSISILMILLEWIMMSVYGFLRGPKRET